MHESASRPRAAAPGCRTHRLLGALYPAEAVVLLFAAFALALYALIGTPLRYPGALYSQRVYHSFVFYAVGLLITVFVLRISDIRSAPRAEGSRVPLSYTWGRYRALYLNPGSLLHDLRLLHSIALMFVVYINLKHLIPFVAHAFYDEVLFAFEARLFGASPTTHLIGIFGAGAAPLLSALYKLFYNYTAFLIIILVLQRGANLSDRFATSFVLLWLLGILAVYAVPTLGPCFVRPDLVSSLPLTEVSEMQAKLWTHKLAMEASPHSPVPVYLISGFPSLHFAVPIIGSVLLGERYPRLAAASWAFVFLTLMTTIYFGWHYLLDDVGSVVLAFAALRLGRRITVSHER